MLRAFLCIVLGSLGLLASPAPQNRANPVVLIYGYSYSGPGADKWMAPVLAESVAADLSRRSDLAVVSTADRQKALAELSRSQTGIYSTPEAPVAPDSAREGTVEALGAHALELGRLLKADYILLGSYSVVAGQVRILSRLVRTVDGRIERSHKAEGLSRDLHRLADSIVPGLLVPTATGPSHLPYPVLPAPSAPAVPSAMAPSPPPVSRPEQVNPAGTPAVPGQGAATPSAASDAPVLPGRPPSAASAVAAQAHDWYARGLVVMYTDPHVALECFDRALELDPAFVDAALNGAFVAGNELDDFRQATLYLKQARPLVQKGTQREATYHRISGLVAGNAGRYRMALADLQRSLMLLAALDLRSSADYAFTLNNIGNVYYRQKSYATALRYMNRAIALLEELGQSRSYKYAIFINNRGALRHAMGQREPARQDVEQARTIIAGLGLEESSFGALVHANLADLYAVGGHYNRSSLHKEKMRAIKSSLRLN